MWFKATKDTTISKLENLMTGNPKGMLGISYYKNDNNVMYYIAVSNDTSSEFKNLIIPEATWAVFLGHGTGISIQQLQAQFYLEWIPSSGYEYVNLLDIKVYLDQNPQNTKYKVWVPIVKVQKGKKHEI